MMPSQCDACGTGVFAGARFCPTCGAPVAAGPPGVETRKVVTVVFCDLVGSTALSGRLDPETLRAVTLRYFDLMNRRIEAQGGTVEKFIGDAVMAVFGVPVTHEDDARRAARAALDMLDGLADLNTELQAALDVRLEVRIGVNTGEVVATADASIRQALVSGEVVNVAARLQQHAPPGGVLVGAATREAAAGTLDLAPAGPLTLAGVAAPVTAYRLLGVGSDDPELVRRFDVPFVGRERELARLRAIRATLGGPAPPTGLVLVWGEAGLGKTRLVRQWRDDPAESAYSFGAGRCRALADEGSLAPLADALRQVLDAPGTRPERDPATPARHVLHNGLLRDGTPSPSLADTDTAVAEVLRELAAQRPVVLCIDDCHWAEPALLETVDRLAAALSDPAVLFVCLGRQEMLERHPAWAVDRPGIERVMLGPLDRGSTEILAAHLVEVGAHVATGRVLDRAEGNPFLLEQLLAVAGSDEVDALPLSVQAVLAARIDALPAGQRTALEHAAVVGRDFDTDTLVRLADRDADAVPEAVGALVRRRLIRPVPDAGRADGYRFSSPLTREVTYQTLAKLARARLHERLAGLLDERGAGPASSGGHLERAWGYRTDLGERDAATEQLRRAAAGKLAEAGRTALARADLPWAENLLGRAAGLVRPGDPAWIPATQALAEVRLARGDAVGGSALLRQVSAAAAGDERAAAHARLGLAALDPGPAMARVARVARRAIPVFRAAGDDLGLARAYLRIAQQQQFLGRHAVAEDLLETSLRYCIRAGAEPERATALGALGISLWLGPMPAAAGIDAGTNLLRTHGGSRCVVRLALHCPLAVLLAVRDREADALAALAVAEDLAGDLGYAEAAAFLPIFAAQVHALAGRLGEAEAALRSAIDACRRIGDTTLLAGARRDLARLLLRAGRHAEAGDLTRAVAGGGAPADAADGYGLRARLAAAEDQPKRALRLAVRAVAEARRTDSPLVRAVAELDSAEAYSRLGLRVYAARSAKRARRAFQEKGHVVGVAWAAALVGTAWADGTIGGPDER